MKYRVPGFRAEASLEPKKNNYIGKSNIALTSEVIYAGQELRGQKCNIQCFKHTCSIECNPGESASCSCEQVKTPTGWQWLPVCKCRKT